MSVSQVTIHLLIKRLALGLVIFQLTVPSLLTSTQMMILLLIPLMNQLVLLAHWLLEVVQLLVQTVEETNVFSATMAPLTALFVTMVFS